jgi:hypothetical protein
MSEWTSASALREQLRKMWDSGDLLAEQVASNMLFPLRLTVRGPSSGELSERFDAARSWATELQQGTRHGYRLVMRDVRHRIIGQNSLPAEAWVDTWEDAVRWLGKTSEAKAFAALLTMTHQQQPMLLTWLQRQPLRALALADQWPHLLAFVGWMQAHPQPGIYLRQVDLPGIHSKFIEKHPSTLADLLDLALPIDAINAEFSGTSQFARRHGFRDKPLRVRFRWLDPNASAWICGGDGDFTVSQGAFARLKPAVEHVFIVENEINFLSFPAVANSLVVFGAGYGFEPLAGADWLLNCKLHYWGDIDTHGFAILDQLRGHHPHAMSFLMDRQTLLAHQAQWGVEPQPTLRDLDRLTPDEGALYDDLRWGRLGDQPVRLEQERIDFDQVVRAVGTCRMG